MNFGEWPQQQQIPMMLPAKRAFIVQMERASIPFNTQGDSMVLHEDKNKTNTLEIQFLVGGSLRAFNWHAETDEKTQKVWRRLKRILKDNAINGERIDCVNLDEMEHAQSEGTPAFTPQNENLKQIVAVMLPALPVEKWSGRSIKTLKADAIGIYPAPQYSAPFACVYTHLGHFAEVEGMPQDVCLVVKEYRLKGYEARNLDGSLIQYNTNSSPYFYRVKMEHQGQKIFQSDMMRLNDSFEAIKAALRIQTEEPQAQTILRIIEAITQPQTAH